MENSEKFLISAVLVFAALAIVLALAFPARPAQQPQPPAAQLSASEALFFRMLAFGENLTGYSYAYNETNDGYPTTYRLYRHGADALVVSESPLSVKKIYFLQNDTIMCLRFMGNESCSSIAGENGSVKRYAAAQKERLFDNSQIRATAATMADGISKRYIFVAGETAPAYYGGEACTEGSFVLDYSNISYQDMPRFGLSPGMPLRFERSFCMGVSGAVTRYYLNYTMNARFMEWSRHLISFDDGYSGPITAPPAGNVSVLGELMSEQGYYEKMANCYVKSGEDKDKCVALVALDLRSTALCDHAGTRRDRCIVSMMPLLLDDSLCQTIASLDYRDDCYIELAGGKKAAPYCGMVQNATKKEFCMNVSGTLPLAPPDNSTGGSGMAPISGGNSTNSTGQ